MPFSVTDAHHHPLQLVNMITDDHLQVHELKLSPKVSGMRTSHEGMLVSIEYLRALPFATVVMKENVKKVVFKKSGVQHNILKSLIMLTFLADAYGDLFNLSGIKYLIKS